MHKKTTLKEDVIGGTLSLTIATVFVKLLGLIYKIPLSYILKDEGMGYFNSAYTLYSLFYIISVSGVPKAITLLISENRRNGKEYEAEDTYKVALKYFLIFGTGISLFLFLFSIPLARSIGNENSYASLAMIAPSIIFTSACGVMRGYLCADMKFSYVARSQVIDAASKTLFGILFAVLGHKMNFGSKYIAALTIFGASIGTAASFAYLYINIKKQKSAKKIRQIANSDKNGLGVLKKIIRIALPLTVGAVAINFANIADLALIMKRLVYAGYTEEQANSLYGNYTTMVTPMIALAGAFVSPVTVSVLPALANAYAKSDMVEYNKISKLSLFIVSSVITPMFFGLTFFSEDVLTIIFSDEGVATAAPILTLSAPTVIFLGLNLYITTALEACGYIKVPIYTTLLAALAKIIIGYVMIGNKSFGISGAVIGTIVFYAVSFLIGGIILLKKCKIKIALFKCLAIPFLNSMLMVLCAKRIMSVFFAATFGAARAILTVFLCFVTYMVMSVICYFVNLKVIGFRQNARKLSKKTI